MSRLPIHPTPETFVTTRIPRSRKYYVGERRNIPFEVPEQRGVETEWKASKAVVYKPDGAIQELTEETGLRETEDGLFLALVEFTMEGYWTVVFHYGPEDESELFQYRVRVRVVA